MELCVVDNSVERPYVVGDPADAPIRLKTTHSLSAEKLRPYTDVPVRSVWLLGSRHTDRDIAAAVEAFPSLVDVYVPVTTNLADDAVRALTPCGPTLRRFGVTRSRITDEGARVLATFPDLREVRLEHSALTDVGLAALGMCPNLEGLYLDGNRAITGSGLSAFVDHLSLTTLIAQGTAIGDDGIGYLSGCTSLRDVFLSSTKVTERCLMTMPANAGLNVALPRELDPERVDEVRRNFPFVVNGVGADAAIDIPRTEGGASVALPAPLRGNALTLGVFTSRTCPPCSWLKTSFGNLPPRLREQFRYVELDVDDHLESASALGVRSVPSVFVMEFGIELDRFVGAFGLEALRERLERVLSLRACDGAVGRD